MLMLCHSFYVGHVCVFIVATFLSTDMFVYVNQYRQVEQIAIGTYHFTRHNNTMDPPQFCRQFYQQGNIFAFNESFSFDPTIDHGMLGLVNLLVGDIVLSAL